MTLQVEEVYKSYGSRPVLTGIDLVVPRRSVVGLVGLNGAGKSTLMSIVSGLRRADRGRVLIGGVDVARRPHRARRLLGLAPQDLGIYPVVTVWENLRLFGELAGLRGRQLRRRAIEVAVSLELDHLFNRPARQLSGGEQRRLHTAVAMLHRPPVLLLDEPTVGVDVATRSRLLDVVRRLADEGAAVCYTTHYLPELEAIADSVAVLHGGRIILHLGLERLLREYGTPAMELSFDGPPPAGLDFGPHARIDGPVVTVATPQPAVTAAETVPHLGRYAATLQSIRLVQPSLESVFTRLTGRRVDEEQQP